MGIFKRLFNRKPEPDPEQLLQTIVSFIQADTWTKSQQIVETHPELLTDAAETILNQLAHTREDADDRHIISEHLLLLRNCRQLGIVSAFAVKTINSDLEEILALLAQPPRLSELPQRIDLCRRALNLIEKENQSELCATLHSDLANNLAQAPSGDPELNIEAAIDHYQAALEVWTRQDFPQDWAMTQNNLATTYLKRIKGNRENNIEVAIVHYHNALEVRTRQNFPTDWAETHNNLAIAYWNRIIGDRGENIEAAIRYYQAALEVYTRQAFPEQWAKIQNNLGVTYLDRIRGNRERNVEAAIYYCQAALEVYTHQDFPQDWAMTQTNLANAYSERIRGGREDNIEAAIGHYQAALAIYTRQDFPEQWAKVQHNLANAYHNRIRGDRGENIEAAIGYYLTALEARMRQDFSQEWAMTQNNLGNAFSDRVRGDQGENIETAIGYYHAALEVYTHQDFPQEWAMTQTNLANAYRNRIHGNSAENMEVAIKYYQATLEVRTREAFPEQWAATYNNLGIAYSDRIRGDRGKNSEAAIAHYHVALEVRTYNNLATDWAETQTNLATAYSERILGDRAENIETAIDHYHAALEVYTRQNFPEQWAATQNNLATAYRNRIRGDRGENIEVAISLLEATLEVRTRQNFPRGWAATQNNLGLAYSDRIRGDRGENIKVAIAYFENSLEVRTYQDFPQDWAATQNNLANAYAGRILGNRAENIEMAINYYQASLKVRTHNHFPIDWAATQNNLANAYVERILGNRIGNIKMAIAYLDKVLEVYKTSNFPSDCRDAAASQGQLYAETGQWPQASAAYSQAIEADATLFQTALQRVGQEAELQRTRDLYGQAAYAFAQIGELPMAVVALEKGRARLLRDYLERNRRDLARLPELGHEALYRRYVDSSQQWQNLSQQTNREQMDIDANSMTLRSSSGRLQQIEKLQADIHTIVQEIQTIPDYEQFMTTLPIERIQSLAAAAPLVYLLPTPFGGLALVIKSHTIHSLPLPQLTTDALLAKIRGSDENALGGYLGAYQQWLSVTSNQQLSQAEQDQATSSWLTAVNEITSWLWQAVMGDVVTWLTDHQLTEAVLIPAGLLGLLPLHAAWTDDPTAVAGRRYALDHITFRYAASAHALQESQTIANAVSTTSLLAIDNPDVSLTFSHDEIQAALATLPHHHHLSGSAATKQAVIAALTNHTVVHFSTHGQSGWREPLSSSLLLADGQLTLGEILEMRLPGIRLAILSACESGIPGTNLPDEVINLPTGLTQAGVAGVVGTLWSVLTMSTAMLTARFYHLWQEKNLDPATALRQAQIWLRDSTDGEKMAYFQSELPEFAQLKGLPPETAQTFFQKVVLSDPNDRSFAHPFHWAAFTFTGV